MVRREGMAEDEIVGWHHQLNWHEFELSQGVADGQGGLCSQRVKHGSMTEVN